MLGLAGMFLSREDLIIRMMPFSKELKEWCDTHPEFADALKINYPPRFITLHAVATSYSPLVPGDEVIGVYTYDSKQGKFKQDFIINKGKEGKEFVLYTRLPSRKYNRFVKDINEFFAIYSKGKYYVDTHHIQFDDIPEELKQRAIQAKNLGDKLKITGLRQLTNDELSQFDSKLKKLGFELFDLLAGGRRARRGRSLRLFSLLAQ